LTQFHLSTFPDLISHVRRELSCIWKRECWIIRGDPIKEIKEISSITIWAITPIEMIGLQMKGTLYVTTAIPHL
jgi:hypothetical protein